MDVFGKFVGKWQSTTIENFDDYMKALGVSFLLRKAGASSTTTIDIFVEGDTCRWKYKIAFKSGDLSFKMNETFDETTADGRAVKSTVTVDGDKLVWLQEGKPCESTVTRTISDDNQEMHEECVAKGVVCIRKYKRLA